MSRLHELVEELREAKGQKKFSVGDKVAITKEGLVKHSRSVSAGMGYTKEARKWREELSRRRGKPATVRRVGSENNVDVEYPDGYYVLVYDYMLKKA
jgi:hypothetical protein